MGLTGGYRDRQWSRQLDYYDYRPPVGYFASVRHPWISLIVLLPLLAVYEIGVRRSNSSGGSLRAGVELWLQQWIEQSGKWPIFVIPTALVGLLLLWALFRWSDRPTHFIVPTLGIIFEGIACGIGIYALCLNAPMLLEKAGLPIAAMNIQGTQVLTYLGVGIYEEAIFRLIGFGMLAWMMRTIFIPAIAAIPIAMLISSGAFALAHEFVHTDPFVPFVFFTRMLIGATLAILFWLRGLGVAVGAHIVYDVVASGQMQG